MLRMITSSCNGRSCPSSLASDENSVGTVLDVAAFPLVGNDLYFSVLNNALIEYEIGAGSTWSATHRVDGMEDVGGLGPNAGSSQIMSTHSR